MDYLLMLLSIAVGAICIYFFGTRNFDYFKKLGIPHVEPSPIIGNLFGMIFKTKAVPEVIQEIYDTHPDAKYVGFYNFSTPIIILKDPELVKSLTIKNFDSFPNHKFFSDLETEPIFGKTLIALKDDEWRNMRALLSPAFTSSKIKMMFKTVTQCAKDFADHLAKLDPIPDDLDMKDAFGRFSLDVIASIACGLTVNSMKNPDNDFYRMGKEVSDFSGLKFIKIMIISSFPRLARFLDIRLVPPETVDFITNVAKTTIETRDAEGIVRPDMIHLMMQARNKKEKFDLSSKDIAAQAFIFLLGGLDSPALTLSFAAHSLALNPEVQRKLQAEVDQVVEKGSGEVSYEDLHAMNYLDGVVSEALRMFPSNAALDRVGEKSFTLPPALPGLEPLEIKPGQTIWIPLYSMHHDPRYFPEPEKFDPERFSEENKSKIPPHTYFPFGLGPRSCLASRFALMEVKLALFYLVAKCRFLPAPKTQSPIKLDPRNGAMMPQGGFWLKVEPRK